MSQLVGNRRLAVAGKFDTNTWASRSMDIFKHVESCGGKFHIEGLENIDNTSEPVVFISNHMSILETMVFPGIIACRREVTFVVKQSLVSHPLFGPVMRARKPITVERKDPIADFKKVMNEGEENLKMGISVVIFPQSKRAIDFVPEHFNTLGIKLAKKAGAKIVPVAIKTDCWKNGSLVKDIGSIDRKLPIYMKFGKPMAVEGAGKSEHQKVIDFISGNLNNWQ